jgi:hypothetical protein
VRVAAVRQPYATWESAVNPRVNAPANTEVTALAVKAQPALREFAAAADTLVADSAPNSRAQETSR